MSSLTFGELEARAKKIAAGISNYCTPGDAVVLLLPNGTDFIVAFLGCLYAEVIPIPSNTLAKGENKERLTTIAESAQPTLFICSIETRKQLTPVLLQWSDSLATFQEVLNVAEKGRRFTSQVSQPIAYLQYTSGSTGKPKGLVITHEAILQNTANIDSEFFHDDESIMVSWLPFFHDMGLVYGVFQPIINGFHCYLMTPQSFMQKPLRWLKAISKWKATHSAAPNFAYELCSGISEDQLAGLDFSSWRVAVNGSEVVNASTLEKFTKTFKRFGWQHKAFCPAYGMAESTLKITSVASGEAPKTLDLSRLEQRGNKTSLFSGSVPVSCGKINSHTDVRIVDPKKHEQCLDGQIGEIWVDGKSVSPGYRGRGKKIVPLKRQSLKNENKKFFATGDLGTISNNELYVLGRAKDLIIINGENHYPSFIEKIVENAHPAIVPNGVVAFSIFSDGHERLILFCEIKRSAIKGIDFPDVLRKVQTSLREESGLYAYSMSFIKPSSLPRTTSGKLKRAECKTRYLNQTIAVLSTLPEINKFVSVGIEDHAALEKWLAQNLAELCTEQQSINNEEPFNKYGLNSMLAVIFAERISEHLHKTISPAVFYDFPSIKKLAHHLTASATENGTTQATSPTMKDDLVAIVGMSCRFPAAVSIEEFWKLLTSDHGGFSEFPGDRIPASLKQRSVYPAVNHGGFLFNISHFDPGMFGLSPREAAYIDPQHRLLLEVTWEALQHAGIPHKKIKGTNCGVYVGISHHEYSKLSLTEEADAHGGTGSALSISANRISYLLDLKGPSTAIDTACSSSLVAVHEAVRALQSNEIDMAIAGGVNLLVNQETSVIFAKAGMLSPTGESKPFDSAANGYVRGEGCGVIILKKLSHAIRDNDNILAIVRGSAVNHNGRSNGITAPNGQSQMHVIQKAMQKANVLPSDIQMVEAHGTGTSLGDPIEVNTLGLLFSGPQQNQCLLTSVKSSIGHLEAAAGIAGLIKTVLCLQHKKVPRQNNFFNLNPHINLGAQLKIPLVDSPLDESRTILAGVSSFGFGGTNAHIILEQGLQKDARTADTNGVGQERLVLLTAPSEKKLQTLIGTFRVNIKNTSCHLDDLSYSTLMRGDILQNALGVVAGSLPELESTLKGYPVLPANAFALNCTMTLANPRIVWVFTGQGSQFHKMGHELFHAEPVFRSALEECNKHLQASSFDLFSVLFGDEPFALNATGNSQPAIFAFEYALAKLLMSWGIKPDLLVGHSIGEYVAACIAGVMDLKDSLTLLVTRARLMQQLPGGSMISVLADKHVLNEILEFEPMVSVAALNSPENVVLSGEDERIEKIISYLQQHQIVYTNLNVSHAFHSRMMLPMLEEFMHEVQLITLRNPSIQMISSQTGKVEKEIFANPDYWINHVKNPVLFAESIKSIAPDGDVFIEIGPQSHLKNLIEKCLELPKANYVFAAQSGKDRAGRRDVLLLAGKIATLGITVDWKNVLGPGTYVKAAVPFLPYEKTAHWAGSPTEIVIGNKDKSITKRGDGRENIASTPEKEIRQLVSEILHIPYDQVNSKSSLIEIGADSILLIELISKIEHKFSIKLSIGQLFSNLSTIEAISNFIASSSYKEPIVSGANDIDIEDSPAVENNPYQLIKQIEVLNQSIQGQLHNLKSSLNNSTSSGVTSKLNGQQIDPLFNANANKLREEVTLTPSQLAYIETLRVNYNQKTLRSKEHAAFSKVNLSDWLHSIDFRLITKEFLYPIVSSKAYGAKFLDIDGNEYIDLAMGYGVNFFGNNPSFILKSIANQLGSGLEIATQSQLTFEVAKDICELTENDRLVFVNTGTEAVMTAIRVARAATGKNKVGLFKGYYHGSFDGYLVQPNVNDGGVMPLSVGIPGSLVNDALLLDYGHQSAIDFIEKNASTLAAILVEPIQSRQPSLYSEAFLQQLRTVTERHGIALIFDEIISGFRVHPGGVRAKSGIKADLTTYGKIIGGGMPIGILAGKSEYLDRIDGGQWMFGDDSFPQTHKIFFGGTFCKHPLAIAAAKAVIDELREKGTSLHQEVNALADTLQTELNSFFTRNSLPVKIVRFTSLFRFEFLGQYSSIRRPIECDLFFYSLIAKGVFTWERRICFLSTQHTLADIQVIIEKVKETCHELKEAGFFSTDENPTATEVKQPYSAVKALPLTKLQQEIFILSAMNKASALACNITTTLQIDGEISTTILQQAITTLVQRCETLRARISKEGTHLEIYEHAHCPVELIDASSSNDEKILALIQEREISTPFKLDEAPLFRVVLLRLPANRYYFIFTVHHIVADGWSIGAISKLLGEIYTELSNSGTVGHRNVFSYSEFHNRLLNQEQLIIPSVKEYWLKRLENKVATRHPWSLNERKLLTFEGKRIRKRVSLSDVSDLVQSGQRLGCTPLITLYSAFTLLLHKLGKDEEFLIGLPTALRSFGDDDMLVGSCSDLLPIYTKIDPTKSFAQYLNVVKGTMAEAYVNKVCTYSYIKDDLSYENVDRSLKLSFNLDSNIALPKLPYAKAQLAFSPIQSLKFDLSFDLSFVDQQLQIECDYSLEVFDDRDVEAFLSAYCDLFKLLPSSLNTPVSNLVLKEHKQRGQNLSDRKEKKLALQPQEKHTSRPFNEIEQQILTLWNQILKTDNIGLHDNFFKLGGQSLKAHKLMLDMQQVFGIQFALEVIFNKPTIEQLGEFIEARLKSKPPTEIKIVAVPLPTDFERVASPTNDSDFYNATLSSEIQTQLIHLAKTHATKVSDILLAVFNLLVHNLSGKNIIGITLLSPDKAAATPASVTIDFENVTTFQGLLVTLEKELAQREPGQKNNQVTRELHQIENEIQISNISYSYQATASKNGEGVSSAHSQPHTNGTSSAGGLEFLKQYGFDLSLYIQEYSGNLNITWIYNTGLFKRETIEDFSKYYDDFLQVAVSGTYAE